MKSFTLSCVLFDLDGTLIDTAPDLIGALNVALNRHGFDAVNSEKVKPFISFGAQAMINAILPQTTENTQREAILVDLLAYYESHIAVYSRFFAGMSEVINYLEEKNLPWGIVTNKRTRFTQPLVKALKLEKRARTIISGDSTPYQKPHPATMFAACEMIGVLPHECLYVGDAQHDIVAGKNAGMKTLAALYGYLTPDDKPQVWGADACVESPEQILEWIKSCY